MLKNILPTEIYNVLNKNSNLDDIYEIRLRLNKPISVNYKNSIKYVTVNALSSSSKQAIICTKKIIDTIIYKASNQSIYAFNEEIKEGFIAVKGGIRIGIVGECVRENGKVKTIKNYSSLNIRIPHEIKNCSLKAFKYLKDNNSLHNTLIISPPGAGKTTFLRDLSLQACKHLENINVLILDERYEIASSIKGIQQLNVGNFTDVLSGSLKSFGFENGIRSMSPQIIITDEIANKQDIEAILYAKGCGVKVIASAHAYSVDDLKNKNYFDKVLNSKVFTRYVVLSSRFGVGTLEAIYDEDFNSLFIGDNICN